MLWICLQRVSAFSHAAIMAFMVIVI